MLYVIIFLLCVIISLIISVLWAINGLVNSIYDDSVRFESEKEEVKTTPPSRPSEQDYYVGDFVRIAPMNAEGIVVSASMGAYDVCTDELGNEVFNNITVDDMRLISPSYKFNGDWDA